MIQWLGSLRKDIPRICQKSRLEIERLELQMNLRRDKNDGIKRVANNPSISHMIWGIASLLGNNSPRLLQLMTSIEDHTQTPRRNRKTYTGWIVPRCTLPWSLLVTQQYCPSYPTIQLFSAYPVRDIPKNSQPFAISCQSRHTTIMKRFAPTSACSRAGFGTPEWEICPSRGPCLATLSSPYLLLSTWLLFPL